MSVDQAYIYCTLYSVLLYIVQSDRPSTTHVRDSDLDAMVNTGLWINYIDSIPLITRDLSSKLI